MTPRSPSLPTPKTLEESAQYYEKLFAECFVDAQNVMRAFMQKREEIRKNNPTWVAGTIEEGIPYADLRIALLTKQINILITTCFHFVLYNKSLCDLDWLKKNIDKSYSSHLEVMEKQFDNCFKFVVGKYFHELFHLMESSFRIFLRHLHPEGEDLATGNFSTVYQALFKQLDIKNRKERSNLMVFMSVIRNGIHTNWVYSPTRKLSEQKILFRLGPFSLWVRKRLPKKDPPPREFEYKGKNYKVVPNEMMSFITWKLLMSFAEDTLELFDEIINHPKIKSMPEVFE